MPEKINTSAILHLICGLPGSGKTTLSRKIEASIPAIRMCPDEWIKDIWPKDIAESVGGNHRDAIEELQWKIGKKILQAGVDVIIEWGTWGKSERDKLRMEAWEIGAKIKFYYLKLPREILKKRILHRNQNLGEYEFYMPEDDLDAELDRYFEIFQEPSVEEQNLYDYIGYD